MFQEYVSGICFRNVFQECVSEMCFKNMFQECVNRGLTYIINIYINNKL